MLSFGCFFLSFEGQVLPVVPTIRLTIYDVCVLLIFTYCLFGCEIIINTGLSIKTTQVKPNRNVVKKDCCKGFFLWRGERVRCGGFSELLSLEVAFGEFINLVLRVTNQEYLIFMLILFFSPLTHVKVISFIVLNLHPCLAVGVL